MCSTTRFLVVALMALYGAGHVHCVSSGPSRNVVVPTFLWKSVTSETAAPILGQLSRTGQVLFTLAATGAKSGLDDTMDDMLLGVLGGIILLLLMIQGRR